MAGQILGILFYKGPDNTGTHVVNLWSSTGTLLASATTSMETASGWQTVNFATPVTLAANTIYIASYHCSGGSYSADSNYFATSLVNGVLTAPSSASSGGNGVYVWGTGSSLPTNTFNATNSWADIIFSTGVQRMILVGPLILDCCQSPILESSPCTVVAALAAAGLAKGIW